MNLINDLEALIEKKQQEVSESVAAFERYRGSSGYAGHYAIRKWREAETITDFAMELRAILDAYKAYLEPLKKSDL